MCERASDNLVAENYARAVKGAEPMNGVYLLVHTTGTKACKQRWENNTLVETPASVTLACKRNIVTVLTKPPAVLGATVGDHQEAGN